MKSTATTKHWLAFTAAASLSVASSYGGQLVTTVGDGTLSNQTTGYTLGSVFTVGSNSLEVTGLGVYDSATGISSPIQVGLYDGNGTAGEMGPAPGAGNDPLLGEVTVPATTNPSGQEGFQFVNLATPIVLVAGQTYTIGAFYNDNQTYRDVGGSGFTFASDFTNDFGAYVGGSALSEPYTNYATSGNPNDDEVAPYVGPNLEYTTLVVPEPSTWALVGVGLGAMTLAAARFRPGNI